MEKNSRLSGLLMEAAATFIQQEANTEPLITVTRVDLMADQKRAIIFVTTIPDDREEDAKIFLKRNAGEFRRYLKEHARLKRIPHIDFMIDAGERHRQNIDRISAEIKTRKK